MAEDGAQAAREGESLLLVDRNLGDAANLIFDRILDGDDLVFVGLDLVERGVERGGFAGAGGAGHQHHAVGLANVAAEALEVGVGEAYDIEGELLNFSLIDSLSSTRRTAFSPCTVGMMETRKSIRRPL